jgi:endoglucanase
VNGLRRGVNLAGALDAERPVPPDQRDLDLVRAAGLDTVRLPVRWSPHLATAPPYRLDPAFLEAVAGVCDAALAGGLTVVLDVHHHDELCADVARETPRFLALWEQLGRRFADTGPGLCLELLNEPHAPMDAATWNGLLAEALAVVRATNPTRRVLVGPAHWNTVAALGELRLPAEPHLVVTVHYYSPFRFTHQGAAWLPGADAWRGTTWGTDAERIRVRADLERAATWAHDRRRPLFVGEFGTIAAAPVADRAAWTARVRAEAERVGAGWALWDLATDFGAYDRDAGAWRAPLRAALLGAA